MLVRLDEQTYFADLQDQELAGLQQGENRGRLHIYIDAAIHT